MKILLSAMLVAAAFSTAAFADEKRTYVVASDGDYPPFDLTLPDGTIAGFSPDLARAICENRKLDCQFVKLEFSGLIPALVAGKIDMVAALTISEERKKSISFSDPTYKSPVYFVGRKDLKVDVNSEQDLKTLKIGVESASIMECYVDQHVAGADKTLYKAQVDALQDLKNGRIDILIGEGLQFQEHFLKDNPDYALLGKPLESPTCFGPGTGIAIRHEDAKLAETLNAGIKAVRADGTYKKINEKYLPIDISPK